MEQRELQEDNTKNPMEEITEEQFLKNLYLFMKKRDTPIERIPNLGFKQIDLFMMFKTVSDLGGYHQVTSHQQWKRVYNTLGGNPRSTSAATCTRRHYEKLLLPYECQLKGILMTMPQHQSRPNRYTKDDDGGQRPSKYRLLSVPPGPQYLQLEPHGKIYSLPLHYHPYYNLAHPVLPPYGPIPSSVIPPHAFPAPKFPQFPLDLPHQEPVTMVREPLDKLRSLAEKYKTACGLSPSEPLNLSVKASAQGSDINPTSSFSPPSCSKNPKFLNKPSTLYTPHHADVISEENETQVGESGEGAPTFSESEKKNETHDADVQAPTPSDSPIFISALMPEPDKDVFETTPKPWSLKADFPVQPAKDGVIRTEEEGFNFSHVLNRVHKEKEGKMEIEVPLSVFRNWLKLYGSSAKLPEAKEHLVSDYEKPFGKTSLFDADISPTDPTLRSPQNQTSANKLRLRNGSSLVPNTKADNNQDGKTSGGFLRKGETGQDIQLLDQQNINKSYKLKPTDFWDIYTKENSTENSMAPHTPNKPDSSPPGVRGFASKVYMEDMRQKGMPKLEVEPSAVLKVNSSPASVFLLSPDEMMKLQNIISSSS
ncbi:hypothetical protein AMECASPLE_027715 [Ameca splendens]|uniref:ARID domain-containing protein n=1 Tax=Ameca splendens TaxID=208324 RepID=A0ABV0XI82_9TELE